MAYDLNKLTTLGALKVGLEAANNEIVEKVNEFADWAAGQYATNAKIGEIPEWSEADTIIEFVEMSGDSMFDYIGELPEGSTSETVVDYVNEKTTVTTDEEVVGMLDEVFGTNA